MKSLPISMRHLGADDQIGLFRVRVECDTHVSVHKAERVMEDEECVR